MCGIAGILFSDPRRHVDDALLGRMGDVLAHRGPDSAGVWAGAGVGLVHRRLSIIDLATGDQPLTNSAGSCTVVFNGEIYNHRELRRSLESAGHRFRTTSDTEVLLHLYQDRGPEMVKALRGMFAFALWDNHRRQLFLARDRVGVKPLYVYQDAQALVFGSELKALLSVPWVPRSVDPRALEDYLTFGMVQGEHCILRNVRRLPPASVAVVRQDRLEVRPQRYWSLNLHPDARWTEAEAVEAIRAKVVDTVRAHMVADVPVGAFLSGGMDSGVVVGVAAGLSATPLHTFSIGFNEARFSELAEARSAAGRFGTDHHEEIATPDSMLLVDELTRYFDEPFADSSSVPTYLVSRLAARSVKVALSGDGGDEAFGGYSRYRDDLREWRVRTSLPQRVREHIVAPLATMWPKADWLPRPLRAKTFLTNVGSPGGAAYANSLAICRTAERHRLLAADLRSGLNGYVPGALIAASYDRIGDRDPLAAMIAADVDVQLPDDYLTKVDRAAMAHGLEVRPVFVDHELLELTATMPSHFKVRGRTTKWLMRAAYRDFLPSGATRRPKRGFSVPLDLWFRGPLDGMFNDTVLASDGTLREFLDVAEVRRIFERHHRGLAHHGATLWSILILARWCDAYMTPAAEPGTARRAPSCV